jgi:transcriptional regulator with XRE-family HTH domain
MLNRALKLLRTYHQMSQVDLAKRLQISNSYLSELEKGDKTPGLELLGKYAETFKMPLSSILLFSERIDAGGSYKVGEKLRITAAEKVLRMLEWLEERDAISRAA